MFFFNKTFIQYKLKVSFFKKFNKIKSVYFYKYWRLKNKVKKKIKLKSFFKTFDLKKKLFFLLKENRSIVKDLFFHKFIKQKKLTKFFSNFKNSGINKILKMFEFSLFNITIQSHFVVFKKDVNYFIKNGFIFVNTVPVRNNFFILKIGDRVQVILNKNYYRYIRIFTKTIKNLSYKIRLKMRKNFLKKKDFFKQRSSNTPS